MELSTVGRMAAALGYETADPRQLGALNLAYLGDTVYDLYIRSYLVNTHQISVNSLHRLSARMVCAQGQTQAFYALEPLLTQEELAVYRRGRNAHSGTVPKNASVGDYRVATGLETLLGHLWCLGQEERIDELMGRALKANLEIWEGEEIYGL
ncbi:MAG: ribonuclease III [Clostridia bacterium]|nr:ribonuclease III [Clostridia bacterium]